jgi:predicted nucleotidyltransferase
MSRSAKSIEMIKLVAQALGSLNEKAVFIGGATVPFYLPEVHWEQIRPTEDVDVVMKIMGRVNNWIQEDELRKRGFTNDTSVGAPICRWVYQGIKVDFMTFDKSVFGFTNFWYKEGIENSIVVLLKPVEIKILNLPYFIATKLEAFKSRGNNNFQSSPDMEDIISVLEVANEQFLEGVIENLSSSLKIYLKTELSILLSTSDFIDSIPGALFNRIDIEIEERNLIQRIKNLISKLGGHNGNTN